MSSIAKSHTICIQTGGHPNDLMSHANTKYGLIPLLQCNSQFQGGIHAFSRVSRAIGQEQPIEIVAN
jgi:hypothetical protein